MRASGRGRWEDGGDEGRTGRRLRARAVRVARVSLGAVCARVEQVGGLTVLVGRRGGGSEGWHPSLVGGRLVASSERRLPLESLLASS